MLRGFRGYPRNRSGRPRVPVPAAILALLLAGPAAAAEAPRFNAAEARTAAAAVLADPLMGRLFSACPADVHGRRRPMGLAVLLAPLLRQRTFSQSECEAHPGTCLQACRVWAEPHTCFNLATALQKHPDTVSQSAWERLFSQACAAGEAAGCTNRAAGMRNAEVPGDIFRQASGPTRELCEHRSFALACSHDDSWGCAMLGQSWRLGEGAPANPVEAIRAYSRACELAPSFVACDFAKDGMNEMGSPL